MSSEEYVFSNESKRDILNHVVESLRDMTNESYIHDVWMDTEGKYAEDFADFYESLMPDLEGILEKKKVFSLSKLQCRYLQKFMDEFEGFSDKYHEAFEFINTEDWKYIQNQAREVLTVFNEDTIKF